MIPLIFPVPPDTTQSYYDVIVSLPYAVLYICRTTGDFRYYRHVKPGPGPPALLDGEEGRMGAEDRKLALADWKLEIISGELSGSKLVTHSLILSHIQKIRVSIVSSPLLLTNGGADRVSPPRSQGKMSGSEPSTFSVRLPENTRSHLPCLNHHRPPPRQCGVGARPSRQSKSSQ